MKIGTLSFGKRLSEFDLDNNARRAAILQMSSTRHLDLLVCAGWSVENHSDVVAIAEAISHLNSSTHIIVETQYDRLPRDEGKQTYHVGNLILPSGDILRLGKQIFTQARDLRGPAGQSVLQEFDISLDRRRGCVGNKGLMFLCCGELNVLQGRNVVRCMSKSAAEQLDAADIIVNPTHDLMGNHGTVIAKRKFLSRSISGRDRIYVSASNWDHAGYSIDVQGNKIPRRKQRPGSNMLHTVFFNGRQQEMDRICDGSQGIVYREWIRS